MEERIECEASCGNVFEDLGLEDSEELFIKSGLIVQIMRAIEAAGLSEAQAAQAMAIEESELRRLILGQAFDTSSDQLLVLLNRLGQNVEIVVTPKGEGQAKVTVRGGREQAAA